MKMSQVQQNLNFLDYNVGKIDGEYGRQTCHALKTFQVDYKPKYGGALDGEWGSKSEKALLAVVKEIQTALKKQGYYSGFIDGLVGDKTIKAAKAFQKKTKMKKVDGRIGVAELKKLKLYPVARDRRNDLISAAKKYIGCEEPSGDNKIIDHYNRIRIESYKLTHSDPWCAAFVSVCADDSDNLDVIRPSACADYFQTQFKKQGLWQPFGYVPVAGSLILYGSGFDHVGIVTSYDYGYVYTIEGNNSIAGHNDGVWRHQLNNSDYYSYCIPPFWKERK